MKHRQEFSDTEIKKKSKSKEDFNDYASLCRRSEEPCDLCPVVSQSRYSSLVHNLKHIIIPLVNLTIYKCQLCLYLCSSQKELLDHKILHNLNATLVIPKLNLDLTPKPEPKHKNCSIIGSVPLLQSIIFESPEKAVKLETVPAKNTIKSRLIFEDDDLILNDDIEDVVYGNDRLLVDLTTDCQVKVEVFQPPLSEVHSKSIHYEELIRPGLFKCKKCSQTFPSRFEAITHEASHIYLKNSQITLCTVCNQFIPGSHVNLKQHILSYHRPSMEVDLTIIPDDVTNIKKYKNSLDTQHSYKKMRLEFEDDNENTQNDGSHIKNIFLKLCDLCFSFCKNSMNAHYEHIRTMNVLGERFKCDKCGGIFFEIRIVKRLTRERKGKPHKRKTISNKERLKSIQQRLKLLKKY